MSAFLLLYPYEVGRSADNSGHHSVSPATRDAGSRERTDRPAAYLTASHPARAGMGGTSARGAEIPRDTPRAGTNWRIPLPSPFAEFWYAIREG